MGKYRVLSFDGGGIRGVLTARLMMRLEEAVPGFYEKAELLAGTSTGAIIAVGLASGKTPAQIFELYRTLGAAVFKDSTWDNIRDLGVLLGAQYDTEPRKRKFIEIVGEDTKLKDLQKKVLVATFQLDKTNPHCPDEREPRSWKAKFFHNYEGTDSDGEQLAVDVLMRSSAAPTYFPIYQGFVDGGLAANNPSMCALAQAVRFGKANPAETALLSFGTGRKPEYIPFQETQNGDWGLAKWFKHIINLALGANVGLADFQSAQMLGENYRRIDAVLDRNVDLDAVAKKDMDYLIETADALDLKDAIEWVKTVWKPD